MAEYLECPCFVGVNGGHGFPVKIPATWKTKCSGFGHLPSTGEALVGFEGLGIFAIRDRGGYGEGRKLSAAESGKVSLERKSNVFPWGWPPGSDGVTRLFQEGDGNRAVMLDKLA